MLTVNYQLFPITFIMVSFIFFMKYGKLILGDPNLKIIYIMELCIIEIIMIEIELRGVGL